METTVTHIHQTTVQLIHDGEPPAVVTSMTPGGLLGIDIELGHWTHRFSLVGEPDQLLAFLRSLVTAAEAQVNPEPVSA